MRLLIVSQYFWPESFRINDLVPGLQARGHEVVVLTGLPNYPQGHLFPGYNALGPYSESFSGARVLRVPLLTRGRSSGLRLVINYLSFALFACLLGPLRCRGHFDAVLIYEPSPVSVGLPGLLMAKLNKAPALIWVQDLWPDTLEAMGFHKTGFVWKFAAALSDLVHRHCNRILVQSRGFVERIEARVMPKSPIDFLPNWAESFYQPCPPLPDSPVEIARLGGFKLLFAGNIGSAQSFETIIGAARRLRHIADLHWIILGDGHRREWLQQEIVRHGLEDKVQLFGQRPAKEMPAWFAHANCLLVTLRADPVFALTIPSKIQSYLASGRPIVAALDGEGATVVRESGAGITCQTEDDEALAKAVTLMYHMTPKEREACGKRARAYYDAHFDRELLLDRLDGWFRQYGEENRCVS